MTGYRSKDLRHKCESKGCFIEALPSWDGLLAGADLPRGIKPMDVDGFMEINGSHIFLEQKGPGVPLCQVGSGYALRSLARLPTVTVVFFRPADDGGYDVIWNTTGGPTAMVRATEAQLSARLHQWALDADGPVAA